MLTCLNTLRTRDFVKAKLYSKKKKEYWRKTASQRKLYIRMRYMYRIQSIAASVPHVVKRQDL